MSTWLPDSHPCAGVVVDSGMLPRRRRTSLDPYDSLAHVTTWDFVLWNGDRFQRILELKLDDEAPKQREGGERQ